MSTILSSITSLDRLVSASGLTSKSPKTGKIKLELPDISSGDIKKWEDAINRHYFACGCPQGTLAIIITLTFFGLYLFLRPSGFHISGFEIAAGSGLFIISGALGKLIGIGLSRRKLRKIVFEIKGALNDISDRNH
ncbi:MAG: hypothetical protein JSU85_02370 [Candidatus Zixiibacteriota bacterium]|nr:MAG: hypothetical protein JSU85_02370 [candidate division Zixibacteria bacterium]